MPTRNTLHLPDIELSYLEWQLETGKEKVPRFECEGQRLSQKGGLEAHPTRRFILCEKGRKAY
jgi:hypothetical protein